MENVTLEQLLKGQDLNAFEIAKKVLEDKPVDSITKIIVDAWRDNGGEIGEFDKECYLMDLNYTIGQLQKAKKALI